MTFRNIVMTVILLSCLYRLNVTCKSSRATNFLEFFWKIRNFSGKSGIFLENLYFSGKSGIFLENLELFWKIQIFLTNLEFKKNLEFSEISGIFIPHPEFWNSCRICGILFNFQSYV